MSAGWQEPAIVLPRAPERLLNNYNFNKQESEISARKTF
jgi:hypothetical protein